MRQVQRDVQMQEEACMKASTESHIEVGTQVGTEGGIETGTKAGTEASMEAGTETGAGIEQVHGLPEYVVLYTLYCTEQCIV